MGMQEDGCVILRIKYSSIEKEFFPKKNGLGKILNALKRRKMKVKKVMFVGVLFVLCLALTGCESSSRSSSPRSNYSDSSSSNSSNKGYGGYDMPNSGDKSFVDYMKRVDPELYKSIIGD